MVNLRIWFIFLEIDSDVYLVILNCMWYVLLWFDMMEGKMVIFICEVSGIEVFIVRLLVGCEVFVFISEGNFYNMSYL